MAAGILLLGSCTHHDKAPEPDSTDQTTTRWVPDPAADLMTPEGTFIRATVESLAAAWGIHGHTGQDAIKSGGYPGFEHAFNNAAKTDDFGSAERNPYLTRGSKYRSIIALSRQGDRFTAEVCADSRQTAVRRDDGQYSMNYLADAVTELTLTFGPDSKVTTDQQHSPPARQKGSAERPSDNVFGTWVLFDYKVNNKADRCSTFAPGTPKETDSSLRHDPPPTLPPDPGWPEASAA